MIVLFCTWRRDRTGRHEGHLGQPQVFDSRLTFRPWVLSLSRWAENNLSAKGSCALTIYIYRLYIMLYIYIIVWGITRLSSSDMSAWSSRITSTPRWEATPSPAGCLSLWCGGLQRSQPSAALRQKPSKLKRNDSLDPSELKHILSKSRYIE